MEERARALWECYDTAVLDLDGVVYVGSEAVAGVPDVLAAAAAVGLRLAYATNNASRSPSEVAAHLSRLGVPATEADVVTSAQAAASMLASRLPMGSVVFVIGGPGLIDALAAVGLCGVRDVSDDPVAVVSGYDPGLVWQTVVDGALLVAEGLPWVASNTDMTVPTPRGSGPGNGVLVSAVAGFTGREPCVAGKPLPTLFEETRRRVGASRMLVVGDRLDTDVAGALAAGLDSLLVMTGVTGLEELVRAAPDHRPTYLSDDLAALARPHRAPTARHGQFHLGGWTARVDGDRLLLTGHGEQDHRWRVLAVAAWDHLDTTGRPVDVSEVPRPANLAGGRARAEKGEPA